MSARTLPLILSLLLCATGCTSYREQPVDLAAIDALWRGRQQGDAQLVDFARILRERGAEVPAQVTLQDGIDLAEAEVLALLWNPQLRSARARAGISAAVAEGTGNLPAPELEVDALHALESVAQPWKLAGALTFTLPLSGRLGLERAHAQRLAEGERLALLTQEWSTLAVLREAWITWSALQVEQAQAARFAEDVQRLAGIAERLQGAGEVSAVAARAVRIAGLRAGVAARAAAAEAEAQRLGLLALLGLPPQAPLTLHPALRLGDDLMRRLGDQQVGDDPRLRQALAAHQVAEASLRLEVRRQYPDLRLGLGYENDRGDRSLGPVFGFTLPWWNTNAAAIGGATAVRAVSAAEVEAAYAAALHDRARARIALDDLRLRLADLESGVAPLVDAQLEDVHRLAGLGDLDVALVLEVFDTAWECRRDLVRLRAGLALAHNRLIALALPAWLTNDPAPSDAGRR